MIPLKCRDCDINYQGKTKGDWYCGNCRKIRRRIYKKKYADAHKDELRIKRHLRDKTDEGKLKYKRYRNTEKYRKYTNHRYYSMDENRKKARYYLSNAVRDGRLIRSKVCEECGKKDWGEKRSMIEGHHYLGYEPQNWLKVKWLCTNCHKIADNFTEGGDLRL